MKEIKKRSIFAPAKGEMAEWSIAAVLKTVEGNTSGGSNPSLSAKNSHNNCCGIFYFSCYSNSSYFCNMNIIQCLQWRYATKRFDADKIIPQEKINTIKEAFNLTATSYGLQPIKLLIIKDKTIREQLLEHTYNQPQILQASHLLVFCVETSIDKDYIVAYFDRVKEIRKTDESILKPYRDFLVNDFESRSQEYIEAWATKQAYLAMGNLLTVCAMEGIDSLPMEGFKPNLYDEVLKLKEKGLKSVLIMPIGYRAEDDMFSEFKKVRKTVAESTLEL